MNSIFVLALLAAALASGSSSPLVYYGSPYSAAIVAPEVVAPGVVAQLPPPGLVAPGYGPVVSAAYPYSSVSSYYYGSSYNVQDYLLNTAAGSAAAYSALPYPYAADYFYRK